MLLFLNRDCARYHRSLLGADRPYQVTLKAVSVNDLVRSDRSNQGVACVSVLQPLLPTTGASRAKDKGFLHGEAVLVLCECVAETRIGDAFLGVRRDARVSIVAVAYYVAMTLVTG